MAILECRVRKNRFECSSQIDLSNKPFGGSGMAHAHWVFCFKSSFYKVLFGMGLDTFCFFFHTGTAVFCGLYFPLLKSMTINKLRYIVFWKFLSLVSAFK